MSLSSRMAAARKDAVRDRRVYLPLLILTAVVLAADQITKAIVLNRLGPARHVDILGGLVRLDNTHNTGAAFGILQDRGVVFAVIAVIVSAAILIFYPRAAQSSIPVRVALPLILGGAVGNLVDRVRLGYVVDFIDLRWWPVFNVADSCIVIGVILLAASSLFQPEEGRR